MVTLRPLQSSLVWALAVLLWAPLAQAASQTYVLQSGQLSLFPTAGGASLGTAPATVLDGQSITIDVGNADPNDDAIVSLLLTAAGPITFNVGGSYAGIDTLSVTDMVLSGTDGGLFLVAPGPPAFYTYSIDPLEFEAVLNSTGGTVLNDFAIDTTTAGGGLLILDAAASVLTVNGITIGEIGPFGSETEAITLKADFVFVGQGVIPEPSGLKLMGLGIVVVGLAGAFLFRR